MDKKRPKNIETDIVFSQSVHAGSRIYYVDVKKTRGGEMFLSLTESKKIVNGTKTEADVSFEKHKIFIYQEDFAQLMSTMQGAIDFIASQQGNPTPRMQEKSSIEPGTTDEIGEEIKINIEF
ncbi:MAG: DUF3276 family protein [Bacteroidaceae bacterium]|nr:DUF3276 family protein [Bacteroidaceae bacterium]